MSDTITSADLGSASPTPAGSASVASQIDSLVAGQLTGMSAQGVAVQKDTGGFIYNTESGELKVNGNPAQVHGPINDKGIDIEAAVNNIQANLSRLQSQFDAVTYDTKTGQAIHTVQGRSRDVLQQQLDTAKRSAEFDFSQLGALKAQRESAASSAPTSTNTLQAEAARMLFAGNGPDRQTRLALYDSALQKAEAEAAAAATLSLRR